MYERAACSLQAFLSDLLIMIAEIKKRHITLLFICWAKTNTCFKLHYSLWKTSACLWTAYYIPDENMCFKTMCVSSVLKSHSCLFKCVLYSSHYLCVSAGVRVPPPSRTLCDGWPEHKLSTPWGPWRNAKATVRNAMRRSRILILILPRCLLGKYVLVLARGRRRPFAVLYQSMDLANGGTFPLLLWVCVSLGPGGKHS